MVTGVPLTVTYARIAAFNRINENQLGASLLNLASGKRVRKPEDNVPDFFRAQRLNRESNDYTRIKNDVAKASALMDVAKEAGEMVYNGIDRMKQLVNMYYDESTAEDEKLSMKSEFSSLVKQVSHIVENTTFDGRLLISDSQANPLDSVSVDPSDVTNSIKISFSADQVAEVSGLTLGNNKTDDMAAVQAELDKAGYYLASANAFSIGLDAQYNLAQRKVSISSTNKDSITNADAGQEMIRAANMSIQHESSFAMMAQANMIRSSVVKLFG